MHFEYVTVDLQSGLEWQASALHGEIPLDCGITNNTDQGDPEFSESFSNNVI